MFVKYTCILILMTIYEWMFLVYTHIVTCIFVVAIVCVSLHFTKKLVYGGFLGYAVNARESRF